MKKKSGKSADHTYVFNSLTKINMKLIQLPEAEMWNGNVERWLQKIVKSYQITNWSELILGGFMPLRPMCFVGLDLGLILSSAVQQPAPHSARRAGLKPQQEVEVA